MRRARFRGATCSGRSPAPTGRTICRRGAPPGSPRGWRPAALLECNTSHLTDFAGVSFPTSEELLEELGGAARRPTALSHAAPTPYTAASHRHLATVASVAPPLAADLSFAVPCLDGYTAAFDWEANPFLTA